MKKIQIVLLALILSVSAVAKPVDKATAMKAAANVLHKQVYDVTPASFTECYLFMGADGEGFVLLSADDCVRPLLGYSLDNPFPTDYMPEHLMAWIDGYQREIASVKALGGAIDSRIAAEWKGLVDGTPKVRAKDASAVAPLLETLWEQSEPYNNRCPYDSVRQAHALVGCVSTATSQVMRYWRHPQQGRGSHAYYSKKFDTLSVNYDTSFYDWDHMPNRVRPWSNQDDIDAISKLCYEVGVAMDMSYSVGGSGAYEHSGGMLQRFSAELALKNHFGYNPAMYAAFKEGHTDEEWFDIISAELDAARPIIYVGSSSTSGHAFVVDGYNEDSLVHINWGWGPGANGYFTLSHLAYGREGQSGYMAFNEMNDALLHVYPITPNDSVSVVSVVSSDLSRGTVSGSGTYPVDRDRVLLLATPKPGYRFDHWASGNTANPIFYFPTLDYSDTAYFVPLSTDTLGYSHNFVPNFDTVFELAHTEWGIRIPAERVPNGRSLQKVMNFIYTTGRYALRIYQGEQPGIPLYEDTLTLRSYGWRTIDLETPITLDGTKPLWITFATDSVNYPAGISPNTGIDDGSWIKHDGVWELLDTTVIGYYTWSILGILDGNTAIDDVAVDDNFRYSVKGLSLNVDNPDALPVAIYDLEGRQLATSNLSIFNFQFSIPGVYLLRCGSATRKIIAIE